MMYASSGSSQMKTNKSRNCPIKRERMERLKRRMATYRERSNYQRKLQIWREENLQKNEDAVALICSAKSLNQVTRIIIRILCLQQKRWSLMNPILKLAPARFIQLIIFKPKNRVSVGFVEECFSLRTSFVSMQWMTTL